MSLLECLCICACIHKGLLRCYTLPQCVRVHRMTTSDYVTSISTALCVYTPICVWVPVYSLWGTVLWGWCSHGWVPRCHHVWSDHTRIGSDSPTCDSPRWNAQINGLRHEHHMWNCYWFDLLLILPFFFFHYSWKQIVCQQYTTHEKKKRHRHSILKF